MANRHMGPSRSAMRSAPKRVNAKVVAPKPKKSGVESMGQFKARIGKMDRDELLKEAEDLLGDETF